MGILYGLALIAVGMVLGSTFMTRKILDAKKNGRVMQFRLDDGQKKKPHVIVSKVEYDLLKNIADLSLAGATGSVNSAIKQSTVAELASRIASYEALVEEELRKAEAEC